MVVRWQGRGGAGGKGKGAGSADGQSQDSPRDAESSVGDAVSHVVTTMCDARWGPGVWGGLL